MARPVSQTTIALELGVSQRAVSKALRDEPGVSDDLRQRVRQTARRLGYRRNHLARALADGQTRLIGLIFPAYGDRFFGRILDGIEGRLSGAGYRGLLCRWNRRTPTDADEMDLLLEHRVDGLMTSPRIPQDWQGSVFDRLRHEGHPIVFINQDAPFPEIGSVASDDLAGMAQVGAHLAGLGHREVAYIGPPASSIISSQRLRAEGFAGAATAAGLHAVFGPHPHTENVAADNLRTFFAAHLEITAVACFNDYVAVDVIAALEALGRRVPEDVSVVGYGDALDHPHLLRLPLTTVGQSCQLMGSQAADLMLRMLGGEGPGDPRYVDTELLVRASTAPNPWRTS